MNAEKNKINCAVIGARGYTGVELVKILLRHSRVELRALTTRSKETVPVRKLVPTLPEGVKLEVRPYDFESLKKNADVAFVCLAHTEAAETVKQLRKAKKIVIDLSADFRLRDEKAYPEWYGHRHPCPELLKDAVYGLSEIYREKIKKADLIANPGCYPTGAALGLWPLLKADLIDSDTLVIDAKSGVSGAGKKLNEATQFCEVNENFYAYKVNRHQHTPEIEQTLSDAAGKPLRVTFIPHLLPVTRGILTTLYAKLKSGVKDAKVRSAFEKAYDKEAFVRVMPEGEFPQLHAVRHTNYCDIGFSVDARTGRIVVVTAIDNLLKGASGQAVQNMNIRLGFPEDEGLKTW